MCERPSFSAKHQSAELHGTRANADAGGRQDTANLQSVLLDNGSGSHLLPMQSLQAAAPSGAPHSPKLPDAALASTQDSTRATNDKKTRRKLWDLPQKLHCPVIGTCLQTNELRRIARNAGLQQSGAMSDYEVHVNFVSAADKRNALSLAAQKALEKKFAVQIRRFSRLKANDALAQEWSDSVTRGDVAGALWALLTHPRCNDELKASAFEEVHMLSHQVGAGQRADLKRLAETEDELAELRRAFDAQQHRVRRQLEDREQQLTEFRGRNIELQGERIALQVQIASLRAENDQLRTAGATQAQAAAAAQVKALREDLRRLDSANSEKQARIEELEQRLLDSQQACIESQANQHALERLLRKSLEPCDNCELDACERCPDLGGRRILCVGGRNRLVEQYRELVARCNGQFEHHDGGLEDSRQRLDAMLSAADAVLCATDNVSHDAYYRLKRFCKRYDKPHVFMPSSGISSFVRALDSVAG